MQWPETADELAREQRALAARAPEPWRPPGAAVTIGGCFVCFPRGRGGKGAAGEPAWAAAALIGSDGSIDTALARGASGAGYEAGLLALREGPLLEAAVRSLPEMPAILLVNATGRDHPRGAGLALHLGALLGIPSVGVTNRPLVARGELPEPVEGAAEPLLLDGRRVGMVLCSQDGCRPLVVHCGWRTDPRTAMGVVRSACRTARTPEPIRRARQAARLARAAEVLEGVRE